MSSPRDPEAPAAGERIPRAPVLILAAVEREAAPLADLLREHAAARTTHLRVTGVGKVSAALACTEAMRTLRPGWVLQVGCGGGFAAAGVQVGDVVIATGEVFADEGVEAPGGFVTLRELGFPQAERGGEALYNEIPVAGPVALGLDSLGTFHDTGAGQGGGWQVLRGPMATVSSATGTADRARVMAARWAPLVESMEGAAAALAAWRERTPFSEVRGVSNLVGLRQRQSWEVDAACRHAAIVACRILEHVLRSDHE